MIQPTLKNFPETAIVVHCVPSKYLNRVESAGLCRRVARLFETQGATVQMSLQPWGVPLDDAETTAEAPDPSKITTRLSLELRAERVHSSRHPISWVLFGLSFSLLPGVTEETFSQSYEIRAQDGFLLRRGTMSGRLVHRHGAGTWAANGLTNLLARPKEERLKKETLKRDLSNDLYSTLSQQVFNAKLQAQVQQLRNGTQSVQP